MSHVNERRPYGEPSGFEGVRAKIDVRRKHDLSVGLGADHVDQFIR